MTDLFQTDDAPVVDPTKNYLEELVGEGKKFKTEQDLARGKAEADLFIARLTQEMEGLRTELNTRLTLEQYMEKMTNPTDPGKSQAPNPDTRTTDGNGNGTGLTPEQIEDIVLKKVSEREAERIQTQNVQTVQDALRGHFGTDYVTRLRETTQALGLDESFMSNLARTQPKAFLRLVGVQGQGTQQQQQKPLDGLFAPPVTHQTSTLNPGNPTRNMAHYEALRQKDPKTYWSAQTQNQLHQDALRLGEEFFK